MKLNIFFSTKKDRVDFLKKQFNIEKIVVQKSIMLSPAIDGISSIKFKNSYHRVPGYWIEFIFNKSISGKDLYQRLQRQIPSFRKDEQVFYPKSFLTPKELEKEWLKKYSFTIKDDCKEKWELFLKEIKSHLKLGRIDVAYIGLNLILKLNPFFLKKYSRYYLFEELAYHYEEQGNLGKAIKCLKLQSILMPQSVEPYLNMSSFFIINGMEEEALQSCEEGLAKNPLDPYLVSNLTIAASNIGDYEFALEYLEKILEKSPNNKLFWKLMGDVLYEIEDNEGAIQCYRNALKIKDKSIDETPEFYIELYSAIGACYYEEENYKEAVKYYKKVLEYTEEDGYILLSLAQIYFYHMEDMETAFYYTSQLIDHVPDSGYGQYLMGMIQYYRGNIEKAKWHLYKARRLMPSYPPIHDAIDLLKRFKKQ